MEKKLQVHLQFVAKIEVVKEVEPSTANDG